MGRAGVLGVQLRAARPQEAHDLQAALPARVVQAAHAALVARARVGAQLQQPLHLRTAQAALFKFGQQ